MLLLPSADIFFHAGTFSESQTDWIQIRADIVSVLIWVQAVYKGYQQTTMVTAINENANIPKKPAFSDIYKPNIFHAEHSNSIGKVFDWGSKGY